MRMFIFRISLVIKTILGILIKFLAKVFKYPCCKELGEKQGDKEVIVALTSYGRRLVDVLPVAIYSLFRQKRMPSKIILVMDEKEKDKAKFFERFIKIGLTIIYDDRDLRSYKKLLPVLEQYPDDLIITVDDDFYYGRKFVYNLLKSYKKDEDAIHTNMAHRITFNEDGTIRKYNEWLDTAFVNDGVNKNLFPTGGGGTLYQSRLLNNDVVNLELIKTLCPKADDIWFFVMAKLNNTPYMKVKHNGTYMVPIDNVYQLTHKGARLADFNCHENGNDIQLIKSLEHYGIDPKELNENI